ncbi:MAG: DUF4349 domain-containing protein [Saprospiraceae bacterium]
MAKESARSETSPAPTSPADAALQVSKDTLNLFGTAVAVVGAQDSLRKFVRTADLKFRVRSLLPATLQIEDIALRNHGFVTLSNIDSEVEYRQATPTSRDSAMETTRFSVHGRLTLRVPYRQLDTTLRAMNRLVDFLDYRHVKAEDVALKMLEDQLLQLRQSTYQQEVNTAAQNGRSENKLAAADRSLSSRMVADQSRIARLKLEDAIQFSTVEIEIYQAAEIRQQMVANTEFKAPTRNFWLQLGDGLRSGVEMLEAIVIGVANLWALILLVVLAYFGIRKYRRKG